MRIKIGGTTRPLALPPRDVVNGNVQVR